MLVVAFEVEVGLGRAAVVVGPVVPGWLPRSTWKKVEPESNQTSRMSLLLA